MTLEITTLVMGYDKSKDPIQQLFGVQSRVEEDYLRQTFQQQRKGSHVPTRAFVSQILCRLDEDYNLVIATLLGKPNTTWLEMQSELLVYERRLDYQNLLRVNGVEINPTVNMTQGRGNGGPCSQNQNPNSGGRSTFPGQHGVQNNFGNRGHGNGRGRFKKFTQSVKCVTELVTLHTSIITVLKWNLFPTTTTPTIKGPMGTLIRPIPTMASH
ncbi:uncharacterized protein LOC120069524 [Benincasa hispida]|uniref:uncharacterized protein LOC120069524 n=1 Tax=Benincasa hispida TaxID=102211 RepID=UPI001902ABCF|nr:uncharacterized protein LOC120069524 [Benincasa hispida]